MIHILIALLCSLLWAGVTIASKLLAGALPSFAFSFMRYAIALVGLLPLYFLQKKKEHIKVRDLPTLFFLGFSAVLLFNVLFFTSLYYSSANSISLIAATNPIVTMLLSAVLYRHVPNRYQLLAFILSFIGASFVITQGNIGYEIVKAGKGELIMLAGVLAQVFYAMALRKVSADYSPLFLSMATGVTGLIFISPFVANKEMFTIITHLTFYQWMLLAYIGIIGTSLGIMLYSSSIKHMGPARSNLTIFSSMPLFVFVLAYLILGEKIDVWQILGGMLVMSSLIIGLRHTR